MARVLRIEYDGMFAHVLSRGNERQATFREKRDYQKFLELLGKMTKRYPMRVLSYVLMRNHYHLLVKIDRPCLSKAIHWLGVSYTVWFNWIHGRTGHLFQGRFKSFVVEEEDYLYRLICYIHRNPLRAKIVDRLIDYQWSSFPCLAYRQGCQAWFNRQWVLEFFSSKESEVRRGVQVYSEEKVRLFENLYHGAILGSKKTIDHIKQRMTKSPDSINVALQMLSGPSDPRATIHQLCEKLKISKAELESYQKPVRRERRPMRDLLIYLLWRHGRLPLREIGSYFQVGSAAVSMTRSRMESEISTNKHLKQLVETI